MFPFLLLSRVQTNFILFYFFSSRTIESQRGSNPTLTVKSDEHNVESETKSNGPSIVEVPANASPLK